MPGSGTDERLIVPSKVTHPLGAVVGEQVAQPKIDMKISGLTGGRPGPPVKLTLTVPSALLVGVQALVKNGPPLHVTKLAAITWLMWMLIAVQVAPARFVFCIVQSLAATIGLVKLQLPPLVVKNEKELPGTGTVPMTEAF